MWKSVDIFKEIVKSQEKFSTFSGKFYIFLKKVCQFIQENLTVFIEKYDDFWQKNLPVFTETFDNLDFPVQTITFSCKNQYIFLKKL